MSPKERRIRDVHLEKFRRLKRYKARHRSRHKSKIQKVVDILKKL